MRDTARLLVSHCFGIREGDRILVLTDDGVGQQDELGQMRDAVIEALVAAGHDPCVLSYPARRGMGCEIPPIAEAACLESDVLLAFNTSLLLYTTNFSAIYACGHTDRRIVLFPAGSSIQGETDYFARMMPDTAEEIDRMAEQTRAYGAILHDGAAHTVRLTAANGTDLTLRLGQLGGSAHSGICAPGTMELIPAGILSLGVDEGSAEGTLVIDYSTTLTRKPLREAIRFEIHEGSAVSVSGGADADEFRTAAAAIPRPDREKMHISEFGLGFNPRAKADGQVVDGENIWGGAHIGIGANSSFGGSLVIPEWHVDCILPNATVEVDGRLIAQEGTYLV